jgi:16S rRNA (guanine527-N7)-methyltransferase
MDFNSKRDSAIAKINEFYELTPLQIKALEDYVWLVIQENNKLNLIGKSTIEDIWSRHVLDSAQLLRFIDNKNSKFADFGSGAGFPGIVLSILGVKEIHLIEKSFKKSDFLKRAKLISPNKIFIHQINLEELKIKDFNCITSRAFAALDKLIDYSKIFLKKDGYCLFLKGKSLQDEILQAKKSHNFKYETFPSLTSNEGSVIKIYDRF